MNKTIESRVFCLFSVFSNREQLVLVSSRKKKKKKMRGRIFSIKNENNGKKLFQDIWVFTYMVSALFQSCLDLIQTQKSQNPFKISWEIKVWADVHVESSLVPTAAANLTGNLSFELLADIHYPPVSARRAKLHIGQNPSLPFHQHRVGVLYFCCTLTYGLKCKSK